jgi:hypothetical protein
MNRFSEAPDLIFKINSDFSLVFEFTKNFLRLRFASGAPDLAVGPGGSVEEISRSTSTANPDIQRIMDELDSLCRKLHSKRAKAAISEELKDERIFLKSSKARKENPPLRKSSRDLRKFPDFS